MLEPLVRRHLFAALRPPPGYDVDVAIGTTYSLDLMALLAVPLAFALFDWEDDSGQVSADPLALLEAARRYAGKTHIFCQAGQIHLPKQRSPLLFELERIVKEVRPRNSCGVFHPKVWILRFTSASKGDPILYRVLCLTRNLTYDRSWDTLLSLDGELTDRKRAIAANHPLGDFVKALPKLMMHPADDFLRKTVSKVQGELRRVRFTMPEGIKDARFHPLGLEKQPDWWFDGRCEKVLAMAPFVDEVFLKRLASWTDGSCVLVSRLEQLQELPGNLLAKCAKVLYLHPDAGEADSEVGWNPSSDTEPDGPSTEADINQDTLTGLHAKLYVTDGGWKSSIWTGSANATNAAFSRNVEFLVELISYKSSSGVDAFLKRLKGQTRFADLLHDYVPEEVVPKKDPDARAAEELAEFIRRVLLDLQMKAAVASLPDTADFQMTLVGTTKKDHRLDQSSSALHCWPVTVPEREAIDGWALLSGESLLFPKLTFEALTGFMAFNVKATVGSRMHQLRFVLNLPVVGLPADRPEHMLRLILQNKTQVLRMLLLLLADSDIDVLAGLAHAHGISGDGHEGKWLSGLGDLALFEPLLKTLERNPEKLSRVARLISDLQKTPGGVELLPPGFLEIWSPIWAVAQSLMDEHKTP
ncbi:MAG: phospholipase D family protein [PVC group bacterium]